MPRARRASPPSIGSRPFIKPVGLLELDRAHPLSAGAKAVLAFNEGIGNTIDLARRFPVKPSNATAQWWGPTIEGLAGRCAATTDYWDLGAANKFVPTNRVTIVYVRQRLDTTVRNASDFGVVAAAAFSCDGALPWGNGTTYWQFGAYAAPNQLTWAGYSYSTAVERWVFVAGPRGMAIWLNGLIRASTSTANPGRGADASSFSINRGSGNAGIPNRILFFGMFDAEWTEEQIRSWYAHPYQMLRRRSDYPIVRAGAAPPQPPPSGAGGAIVCVMGG